MLFSDVSTGQYGKQSSSDALRAEQHWRAEMARVLRNADVRSECARLVRRLIPRFVRAFVNSRAIVDGLFDHIARWIEPGGIDLLDTPVEVPA